MYDHERGCPAFAAALNKYGEDDFDWGVLIDGLTETEAQLLEAFAIDMLKPRYNISARWFNARTGTRVLNIDTGIVYTSISDASEKLGINKEAVRRICSMGRFPSDEFRLAFDGQDEKLVREPLNHKSPKGQGRRAYTGRWSEEILNKFRAAARGRKEGISREMIMKGADAVRRKVKCIQTGTVFRSAAEAALAHGLAKNTVHTLIYSGGTSYKAGVSFVYMPKDAEVWA